MGPLAIIGGSGFETLPGLVVDAAGNAETRWGRTSAPLTRGMLSGLPVLFLARHGSGHSVPPHLVNYRANVQALADAGARQIVALGAVGGITEGFGPGVVAVPDQLIDYSHGRVSTFHEGGADGVVHVDFSWPYTHALRAELIAAGQRAGVEVRDGGTYAVTQGPRLETAAEIRRLARDGCDIVGMTAMPEAALARERGLDYATLAFTVNWAAGISEQEITMDEIRHNIDQCAAGIGRLLGALATTRRGSAGVG
jgi:5'-methylthioadenosine phosphorylase/5'-methylthioinosine phosphorylase